MKYTIFTDGSCYAKTKNGSYYFLVLNEQENIVFKYGEYFPTTTISRMEIMAVLHAMYFMEELNPKAEVIIHSDSQYVVNTINKGWIHNWKLFNFHNRPNSDLWIKMYDLIIKYPQFKLKWIRGHQKITEYSSEREIFFAKWNGYVDEKAVILNKNKDFEKC